MEHSPDNANLVTLTTDIVAAYVSNNQIGTGDIAGLISAVHSALGVIGQPAIAEVEAREPAVSVKASVKPDYIICLEDGKKLKMLKRYIATRYDMTPAEYRAKWGLKSDYPMVAPNYSETRKALALNSGLGRKSLALTQPRAEKITAPVAAKRRGRPKAAPVPVESSGSETRKAPSPGKAPSPKSRTLKTSLGDAKDAAPKRRKKSAAPSAEPKARRTRKSAQAAE